MKKVLLTIDTLLVTRSKMERVLLMILPALVIFVIGFNAIDMKKMMEEERFLDAQIDHRLSQALQKNTQIADDVKHLPSQITLMKKSVEKLSNTKLAMKVIPLTRRDINTYLEYLLKKAHKLKIQKIKIDENNMISIEIEGTFSLLKRFINGLYKKEMLLEIIDFKIHKISKRYTLTTKIKLYGKLRGKL